MRKGWVVVPAMIVIGVVITYLGCGGDADSLVPLKPRISQLFFTDNAAGPDRGTLYAVNPSNPAQPSIITDNVNRNTCRVVYSAGYDSGTKTYTDVALYALVFEKDGKLFRLDEGLRMKQVSKESNGDLICAMDVVLDLINPERSLILYRSETGGSCSGNWKSVYLGSDNNAAPLSIPNSYEYFASIGEGSWHGIVWNNTQLKRLEYCDEQICNSDRWEPKFIAQYNRNVFKLGEYLTGDKLLKIDGSVFIYYPGPHALSGLIYNCVVEPDSQQQWDLPSAPQPAVYFSDGGNILRVENSGYGTNPNLTQTVTDNNVDATIWYLQPTLGDDVIYVKKLSGNLSKTVFSVSKNVGSTPLVIDQSDGISVDIDNIRVSGNRIYYTRWNGNDPVSAVQVFSDNTNRDYKDNAYWAAGTLKTSFSSAYLFPLDRILLVTMDPSTGLNGVSVSSYSAETYADQINLGTWEVEPGELVSEFKIGDAFGSSLLGWTRMVAPTSQADVFYVDASKGSSLQRVLRTPNLDDVPVEMFH